MTSREDTEDDGDFDFEDEDTEEDVIEYPFRVDDEQPPLLLESHELGYLSGVTPVACLEGPIAAGKTSVLEELQLMTSPLVSVFPEPVNNWTAEIEGGSLLERFYRDPGANGFRLETKVLKDLFSRALDLRCAKLNTQGLTLYQERSFLSARKIFISQLDRFLSFEQEHTLFHLATTLNNSFESHMIRFALLVPKEVAWSRIQSRARKAEASMTRDHFEEHYYRCVQYSWSSCHFVVDLTKRPTTQAKKIAEAVALVMSRLRGFVPATPIPGWVKRTKQPLPDREVRPSALGW